MPKQQPLRQDLGTPGSRIRFLREAKGMSQQTLAAAVFATQPAVSQWENDLWRPGRATQKLVAEALGTTRLFLFGEDPVPQAVGQ